MIITDLRNNTYFAVLFLTLKGQDLQIDARPSDAIAVALRMKAPIYASTQVLEKSKSLPSAPTATKALREIGHPGAGSNYGGRRAVGYLVSKGRAGR